ncbi:MAG: TRAP transporter small permease subunit [Desulfobacterales bacterium]|jgi:TRAP-type C4-dicarboxylate transport system permease small subunit
MIPLPQKMKEKNMNWARSKKIWDFADGFIDKSFTILIVVGGAVVTLTVILQVALRYIFKAPLFGLEEFSRLIAVWVYFLGAIFGTKLDAHVQGDVAERLFKSSRSKSIVKTTTWCLSLVLCILLLYHAGKYSAWLYGTGERTTGLWWPRILSVGSMFFGAIFMTFYAIANFLKYFGEMVGGSKEALGG